ncbi:Peptidyl-prolyl cis-trans isomerase cyp8 [Chytridiales sp. JEL 0842]|nr:Peptidyl-prolyl cis-trans isomerase cyp8 [Chytridiales sp. JEL 0842]
MGKGTDKMYITHSEWSTLDFGQGGYKAKPKGSEFKRLPFNCCALSLLPFETPRCTKDGYIFDLVHIIPWLKKYHTNPITGEPLESKDLIALNFYQGSDGTYQDPITFKTFNENTHIVAVPQTGNVYAYETIEELNVKAKNWKDLLTDEPFKKKDLITLQDPHNLASRNINQFHYKKNDLTAETTTKSDDKLAELSKNMNNTKGTLGRILSEVASSSADAASKKIAAPPIELTPAYVPKEKKSHTQMSYSTNSASAAFTSLGASAVTSNKNAEISEEAYLINHVKENGLAQIKTTFGTLGVELYCRQAPRTCYNFIMLAKTGFYKKVPFHRLIRGFMVQTGDPTGTGRGGKSYFDNPFGDEYHQAKNVSHDARGILSMANKGPDTNTSQFFITFGACKHLDQKHTIFGKIVGGIEVLKKMEFVEVDKDDRPTKMFYIEEIEILKDPYEDLKKSLEAPSKKPKKDKAKVAEVPEPPKSSGVGRYLDARLTGSKRDLEEENGEKVPQEKKKAKASGGFGNFGSW